MMRMRTREQLIDKIKFMDTKGKAQSALAEYGMGDYLNQLSAYEEMLAAGKIKWR
jgi:hypothetical protein